jgi:hypothetical protein
MINHSDDDILFMETKWPCYGAHNDGKRATSLWRRGRAALADIFTFFFRRAEG